MSSKIRSGLPREIVDTDGNWRQYWYDYKAKPQQRKMLASLYEGDDWQTAFHDSGCRLNIQGQLMKLIWSGHLDLVLTDKALEAIGETNEQLRN